MRFPYHIPTPFTNKALYLYPSLLPSPMEIRASVENHNPIYNNTIINNGPTSRRQTKFRAVSASWDAVECGDPPRCHPGTRTPVQDSVGVWPDDPNGGPVKLISGWAGTGKTTLAQTLAEMWARQYRLLASFFFSRSIEDRNTTDWFAETILHQIFQIFDIPIPEIPYDLPHLYWSHVLQILPSLPLVHPMVIVIDGLDGCNSHSQQKVLLGVILATADRFGGSIRFLISCRPERHLEAVFNQYADKLGPSYRIILAQSPEDNKDIRTFLRASFDRICQDRRRDGAMSIAEGTWPSDESLEELVDRASGQFVFAATAIAFVDDDNEDPVELLDMILEHRSLSFERVDSLYLVILQKAESFVISSPHLHQLMYNLLLHLHTQRSLASDIALFWFTHEVKVNLLVRHLQAILVRPNRLQEPIQFRHKSLHDFIARPYAPHPFSLAEMNPISRFFFLFRTTPHRPKQSSSLCLLRSSQWLAFSFLRGEDHQLLIWLYDEEARRLHQKYLQDWPSSTGCSCVPQLIDAISTLPFGALGGFTSCGHDNCIITPAFVTLCRMTGMELPVDSFIRAWNDWQESAPISLGILKSLLWLRILLRSLLNPLPALAETTLALVNNKTFWSSKLRGAVALVNLVLCFAVWINTRSDVILVLNIFHISVTYLLRCFLRFDLTPNEPQENPAVSAIKE